MMLKGHSGRIATGFRLLPAGASQREKRVPAALRRVRSRAWRSASRTGASSSAVAASAKNRRASALAAMSAMVSRRRRGRQRRHGDAGAQGAEEHGGIFERTAGADGDGLGRADALALQGRGDAIHHRVEGGEGDAAFALDQGRVVRAFLRMEADQLAIAGEGAGEQFV
jgi:hypothetical protein